MNDEIKRTTNHNRRSIRLKNFDYSQPGAYFVTICTISRKWLFGEIHGSAMHTNELGAIVETCWLAIPKHFGHVELDEFIIMPNHLHGIIWITDPETGTACRFSMNMGTCRVPTEQFSRPVKGSLPTIIRSFKSAATKQTNEWRKTPNTTIWQRGYFERVVRDEDALKCIRTYIKNNPCQWQKDREKR